MSVSFNEFQKELRNRKIDPQIAYVLTLLYERQMDQAQQFDAMTTVLTTFADSLSKMVGMHQSDQQILTEIARKTGMIGQEPGIDVQSVAHDPNDV